MTQVTENPATDALVMERFRAAVAAYGDRLVVEAQARADVITGLMRDSLVAEPPEQRGSTITVTVHDGPADDGKTYGAAEEVNRGHMFLRPALDATWGDFPALVAAQFGGPPGGGPPGAGTPAAGASGALPGPSGTWHARPGGKEYKPDPW